MTIKLVVAAMLAAPAAVAPAAVTEHAPSAAVRYSDLDLTSRAGATEFRRRVDREVVMLSGGFDVRDRPDVIAARHQARKQADAVIDAAA